MMSRDHQIGFGKIDLHAKNYHFLPLELIVICVPSMSG